MAREVEIDGSIDLAKVMLANFVAVFLSASGVGFTLGAAGILQVEYDLYLFTMAFSTFWGFVGAGMAWIRNRDEVDLPQALRGIGEVFSGTRVYEATRRILSFCEHSTLYVYLPGATMPSTRIKTITLE